MIVQHLYRIISCAFIDYDSHIMTHKVRLFQNHLCIIAICSADSAWITEARNDQEIVEGDQFKLDIEFEATYKIKNGHS